MKIFSAKSIGSLNQEQLIASIHSKDIPLDKILQQALTKDMFSVVVEAAKDPEIFNNTQAMDYLSNYISKNKGAAATVLSELFEQDKTIENQNIINTTKTLCLGDSDVASIVLINKGFPQSFYDDLLQNLKLLDPAQAVFTDVSSGGSNINPILDSIVARLDNGERWENAYTFYTIVKERASENPQDTFSLKISTYPVPKNVYVILKIWAETNRGNNATLISNLESEANAANAILTPDFIIDPNDISNVLQLLDRPINPMILWENLLERMDIEGLSEEDKTKVIVALIKQKSPGGKNLIYSVAEDDVKASKEILDRLAQSNYAILPMNYAPVIRLFDTIYTKDKNSILNMNPDMLKYIPMTQARRIEVSKMIEDARGKGNKVVQEIPKVKMTEEEEADQFLVDMVSNRTWWQKRVIGKQLNRLKQ